MCTPLRTKLFLFLLISSIVTGNEDLCLLCKCSTTNIVFRDKFYQFFGGLPGDEINDWSPFAVVADPSGKFLSVNCSRSGIPSKWPPVEMTGIIGSFERNGFEKLPKIPDTVKRKMFKLSLSQNGLSQVYETDFEGYTQLRTLDLSSNRIRLVKDWSFSDLRYLEYLDLSGNKIEEVGKWMSNSDIDYLDLSDNYVSFIKPEALQGLKNLAYLDLSNNLLKDIPDNFASSLNKLKFIYLTGNEFEVVPRFPRSLRFINISSNGLRSLVLPQIDDLFVLDVSNNDLDDLENVYEQLALKVLKASHNHLSTVGEWKSSELRVLDLSYNKFKSIPDEINSEKLPHLRELYLDGNPLNEITFNQRGKEKPFTDLEILSISSLGNLTHVNRDSFNRIILQSYVNCSEEKGVFVDISNNKLKKIEEDSFHGYPICSVDLSRNYLLNIPERLFQWENLNSVNLQHNPWNCICDLQWMLDKYLPHFYKIEPRILIDLKCASPSRFKDRMFVYWYNSSQDVFCKGPSYFQYEYAEGKFFEVWTVSMIMIVILCVIIIIMTAAILILLILRSKRAKDVKNKSKRRSKPIFGELRINADHKYNEINQDGSV